MNFKKFNYTLNATYFLEDKRVCQKGNLTYYSNGKLIGLSHYSEKKGLSQEPMLFVGLKQKNNLFAITLSHISTDNPPLVWSLKSIDDTLISLNKNNLIRKYIGLVNPITTIQRELSFFDTFQNAEPIEIARKIREVPISELREIYFNKTIIDFVKDSGFKKSQIGTISLFKED